MSEPSRKFVALLSLHRVFEPFCTLCDRCSTVPHLLGRDHCGNVRSRMAQFQARARDELWLETFLVGGRVRFNMLDGELQALRYVQAPVYRVMAPKDLPLAQHWFLVGPPAVTATTPGGGRGTWPNLQTLQRWYDQMVHAAQKLDDVLQVSSIKITCLLCPSQWLSASHVLGGGHYNSMWLRAGGHSSLDTREFSQTYVNEEIGGGINFNHLDGSLHLVRQPDDASTVGAVSRAAATQRKLSFPPTPPRRKVAEPACLAAVRAATALPPDSTSAAASTSEAEAANDPAWDWWRDMARKHVSWLEEALSKSVSPAMMRECSLCKQGLLASETFTEHVACNSSHRNHLEATYACDKGRGDGWWQNWGEVAKLHHWTLEIIADQDLNQ